MKSFLKIYLPLLAVYLGIIFYAGAAPVSNIFRNIIPESDLQYDLGTSTPAARWSTIFTQNASTTNLTAFNRLLVGGTATTTIRGDSATSTFSWSVNIPTGQCYQVNGTCLSTGGITSLNGLSGSSQTFAVTNSNTGYGDLSISSSGTTHTFTTTASSSPTFGFIRSTSTAYIPALSNLTSNGFVKTSGGVGTLSVDTATYLTDAITSLNGLTGATQTFTDNDYVDITSAGTAHTFTGSTSPTFGTIYATSSIGTASNRVPNIYATNLDTTILINDFVSGDLEVSGDIYNYGGDHFFGTGLATTTLTVSAANVLTFNGGGFVAQASSTVVGVFRANSLNLNTALTLANGGTNATSFTTSGNAVYYNGTSLLTAPLGSAITIPFASSTAISLPSLMVTSTGQLSIPNASDPTVDATGEIAINTTAASTSLRVYDGTAERVSNLNLTKQIVWATLPGETGTTTVLLANLRYPITVTSIFCKTEAATTSFEFTDGTNATDNLQCKRLGSQDDGSIANASFIMREDFKFNIGTAIGQPSTTTITYTYLEDAD